MSDNTQQDLNPFTPEYIAELVRRSEAGRAADRQEQKDLIKEALREVLAETIVQVDSYRLTQAS